MGRNLDERPAFAVLSAETIKDMGPLCGGPYTPLGEPDEHFPLVRECSHLFANERYALASVDRNRKGGMIAGRLWSTTERNSMSPAPILSFEPRQ